MLISLEVRAVENLVGRVTDEGPSFAVLPKSTVAFGCAMYVHIAQCPWLPSVLELAIHLRPRG